MAGCLPDIHHIGLVEGPAAGARDAARPVGNLLDLRAETDVVPRDSSSVQRKLPSSIFARVSRRVASRRVALENLKTHGEKPRMGGNSSLSADRYKLAG
jgi:hypothetical protein